MFPHRPWQHFSFPGALITGVTTVTVVTAVRERWGLRRGFGGPPATLWAERCGPLMHKLWEDETNLRIAPSHKHLLLFFF